MFTEFNWSIFADDVARLAVATVLGGVLGFEREINGHWAGLRTHMMVALGAAVFTLAGVAMGGPESTSRVVQGVAAGIGFLGAGTILKLGHQQEIKGLTTASSIWLAAGLGTTAGLAQYALAGAALGVSLFVLVVLRPVERVFMTHIHAHDRTRSPEAQIHPGEQDIR